MEAKACKYPYYLKIKIINKINGFVSGIGFNELNGNVICKEKSSQ